MWSVENYHDWKEFIFEVILIGLIFSFGSFILFKIYKPEIISFKDKNGFGFIGLYISTIIILFFSIGLILNESSVGHSYCENSIIENIYLQRNKKERAYKVLLKYRANDLELRENEDFYRLNKEGDTVNVCLVKEFLGYSFFTFREKSKKHFAPSRWQFFPNYSLSILQLFQFYQLTTPLFLDYAANEKAFISM